MNTLVKYKADKPLVKSTNLFPVVGIGASAGGMEAFKKLIKAIPENSGMAYIFVQHLAPSHESVLPELLQKITAIPIHKITDNIRVEPDNIYIIPANKLLKANDGVLELIPRPPNDPKCMSIDIFLTSLAEVHGTHTIGVVLSGTGKDGTIGLKTVKDHGGVTFAEEEASAAFVSMPRSAVQAGVVDFILRPEDIPKKIADIKSQEILTDEDRQKQPALDNNVYKQILSILRISSGTDFTYYKQTTIRRRISRRLAVTKIEEPAAYFTYLRENKSEQDFLYQDLLIHVTEFFRDHKIFDTLRESVFPNFEKFKSDNEPIRIWIAGCSTGQEAYSIAICLKEFLSDVPRRDTAPAVKVQIFATDISEPAIAKARSGIYTKGEVEGLSLLRLQEYFTATDGGYLINKTIRELCVFAVHNFLKDPPFAKIDLVSCRNVLIYMEPYLQQRALTTFHYALNQKGYLLLGKAETTSSVSHLFGVLDKSDKLFTRKEAPGRYVHTATKRSEQILRTDDNIYKNENPLTGFQKTADEILLSRYTPAGVIVNDVMEIVHFHGSTGIYLEPDQGKASLNLLKMARKGLAFELRNLLHKAKKDNAPVIKENIPVLLGNKRHYLTIEAIPIPNATELYYLVLFHHKIATSAISRKTLLRESEAGNVKALRIRQLEQELLQLREDTFIITEDQEAANGQLQTANEQLMSGSEELQILNEELETSKEELQITHENLNTVYHEMVSLNDQIKEARNYAESIVTTIREPLLVLDENLRVKTANNSFYKTFLVNEAETEGVLFFDLGKGHWNVPELRKRLQKILTEKTKFTDLEVIQDFQHIGKRVMLLNGTEMLREKGVEKLILLAIDDVTEKVLARKKIENSNKRYHDMLMQSPFAFSVMKGKDMKITLANNLIKKIWGKGEQVEGKTLLQVLPELKDQPFPGILDTVYTTGNAISANEILARVNYNGIMEDHYFNVVYQPHFEADETVSGVITIAHEVTNQVLARKKIEESEQRFRNLVENSPYPICILKGKDMMLELCNEAVFKIWNVDKDAIGKPFLEIVPEMKGQPFMGLLTGVFESGMTHYGNEEPAFFTLVNGEKQTFYFNFIFQPYRESDGYISGVMVVAVDVTEQVLARKRMEAQALMVKNLLMTAPGFIATLTGRSHVYDIVNEQYQGLFGKRKIKGKPIMEALPELEGQGFDKLLDKVYNEGNPYVGIDIPVTLARDENMAPEERFFNFSYQPMYDENKNVYSILVFGYEVTEQVIAKNKNLENEQLRATELDEKVQQRTLELSKANEDLKKMNQELESFTYISSHDLQEPLRKIRTFVSYIQQSEYAVLSDVGKDYFERINNAVVRLQTLIKDLLEYSHTDFTDCQFINTDLDIIIKEVKAEFNDAILEKSAMLEAGTLGVANISPFQFRQVINNLVANSLKFSKPGVPPHITISSRIVKGSRLQHENRAIPEGVFLAESSYCYISFTDNGIGFDPVYKDKIFQVFQRLHGKEKYAGTGIGLAIVKRIIDNLNGYITATGEPGKGARFDIYLPCE